jgi:hypothetical protein
MRLACLALLVFAASALGQEAPRTLTTYPPFEAVLYEAFPELADPEPAEYFFVDLRQVRTPRHALRWFREMRECLEGEGLEIREHIPLKDIKFYRYSAAWAMRNHRATELRGVWFVESVAYHDILNSSMAEQTIRHEFIHHLIGLTHHPLTPVIVGRCMPALMLDERKYKDAGSKRPRGALPQGFWRLRNERVGPVPLGRDGVVGRSGIEVGSLRGARGAWVLPALRTP